MLSENERWILSFYRTSEITGAMFFARMAKLWRPGPVQTDLTYHFADEAQHARWFTECLEGLGETPLRLSFAYQDDYLETAGAPTNLMEVLSITHAFELRVLRTYARHLKFEGTPIAVQRTIQRIVRDEKGHVEWVRGALKNLETEFGKETIRSTLERHAAADRQTYRRFLDEYGQRFEFLARDQEIAPAALA